MGSLLCRTQTSVVLKHLEIFELYSSAKGSNPNKRCIETNKILLCRTIRIRSNPNKRCIETFTFKSSNYLIKLVEPKQALY